MYLCFDKVGYICVCLLDGIFLGIRIGFVLVFSRFEIFIDESMVFLILSFLVFLRIRDFYY